MTHVFTYGTLMFDAVWELVAGRPHPHVPAILTGYRRCAAANRVYPVIVPGPGELAGRLYRDVYEATLDRLDAFEGSEYHRRDVRVRREDGRVLRAWVYVLNPAERSIAEDRDWDAGHFERVHLADYLSRHRGSRPETR